ncbi:MAG: hypothetical protein ACO33A_14420 [Hyphomonas sp.]
MDEVEASIAEQRKGSELGAAFIVTEAAAVAVGFIDGPQPGPADAAIQTSVVSSFKKILMDTVSSTAIDVALNGAASALTPPPPPQIEVPGIEVGADPLAGTKAEVGVASPLSDEARKMDIAADAGKVKLSTPG